MTGASSERMQLVYVRPSSGGILDYSESIIRVLRLEHPPPEIVPVTVRTGRWPWVEGRRLARTIESLPGIVYADLGSGDRAIFWALNHLRLKRDLVVTIHDPGVFVSQLFALPYASGGPPVLHDLAFHAGRALNRIWARPLFRRVLRRARMRIVLNESIQTLWGCPLTYLPQPVYSPTLTPHTMPSRPCVAFAGYWGQTKGLDELLKAYASLLPSFPDARFVIAGEGASRDRWSSDFRARARAVSDRIELPGFLPSAAFGSFLSGLTALVLPYRADVPGGASAMLMRAQQAGVPLIVSSTPFLSAQVDPKCVTLVPPRDADALARAIADHLRDPVRFQGRAAREQARVYERHGDPEVGRRLRGILDAITRTEPASRTA